MFLLYPLDELWGTTPTEKNSDFDLIFFREKKKNVLLMRQCYRSAFQVFLLYPLDELWGNTNRNKSGAILVSFVNNDSIG